MARPVWRGSITFGLVSIPVALYSAVDDHTVHFHQLQRGTNDRIRYRRVNERTGDDVGFDDIVKGREVGDGEYVVVEPDELADIAPGRSRSIEIESFVALDEIDPVHFRTTYWLGPSGEGSVNLYRLLAAAMARTNRVGIAQFVMRNKQYLTAVRADRGVLALDTLYFADEIRDPADVLDVDLGKRPGKGKQLDMAVALIEAMEAPWRPQDYRDTYTERVEKLVADKKAGKKPEPAPEPAEPTEVSSLMDVLQRSVAQAKGKGASGKATKSGKGSGRKPDLDEASKTDLVKLARKLGIAGRSTMTAAELRKAIRRAEKKAGRAA